MMNKLAPHRLPLVCVTFLLVLTLSWALPALYETALLKSIDKTHLFYSPTLKRFIYTEQIRGYDEKAAAKSEGHHADIVYKDEDGVYYDRLSFEAALPFIYFRNMELRGLLPLHLEGRTIDRKAIEKARRVLELNARDFASQRPSRDLLPLIDADPGQAALLYPADRFRLTETRLEFVNADRNTVDEALSKRFSDALSAQGFRFPARYAGGNFTTFKPYEGGIFLVDSGGKLFHLLRRDDMPEVRAVPLPEDVVPRHILVSESRERLWLGLMTDEKGGIWLIRQRDLHLVPLKVPGYVPAHMDAKLIFDPLYLTVIVSDENIMRGAVYHLPKEVSETPLVPFRTFTHSMSRSCDSWQSLLADAIFPFRLDFHNESSMFREFHLQLSPHLLSHALPCSLLLSVFFVLTQSRRKRFAELFKGSLLVISTGIFGLMALLLLRDSE